VPALVDSPLLSAHAGIIHFFGTRSEPAELISKIQIGQVTAGSPAYPQVISLKQVHGTNVVVLDRSVQTAGVKVQEGDALVTDQFDLALVVRTADCVPILVADVDRKVIAAIHAGWRGILAGIVPKALSVLRTKFGSQSTTLRVAIGPSIGVCCYEVDAPVIQPLQQSLPSWADFVDKVNGHKAMLNLKKLVAHQFSMGGVFEANLTQADFCTSCRSDLFYSYRRQGRVEGTMISGIMLRNLESIN
jgi:YfiH family protein